MSPKTEFDSYVKPNYASLYFINIKVKYCVESGAPADNFE